jgi:hypothetical protein
MICNLHQSLLGLRNKVNEVGGAYGIYVGKRNACTVMVWNMNERDHLEDLSVDDSRILNWIL